MKWEKNIWTGNYIARINDRTRIVRYGEHKLYSAEYWGDYSLRYPVKGHFCRTIDEALIAMERTRQVEGL